MRRKDLLKLRQGDIVNVIYRGKEVTATFRTLRRSDINGRITGIYVSTIQNDNAYIPMRKVVGVKEFKASWLYWLTEGLD